MTKYSSNDLMMIEWWWVVTKQVPDDLMMIEWWWVVNKQVPDDLMMIEWWWVLTKQVPDDLVMIEWWWVMISTFCQKYHGSNIIYVLFLRSTNNIYKRLIYSTIETYLRIHLTYQNKENLWIHLPSHPSSAILWCHQFLCDIIRVKTARYELNKKA